MLGAAIAITGAGAALLALGKSVPNPQYNLNLCQATVESVGYQTILVGNQYCNESSWGTAQKAGFFMTIVGGLGIGLGFLPHL